MAVAVDAVGQTTPTTEGDCAINVVFGTLTTDGYLGVSGFAFDLEHGAPVQKVEMYLDGAPVGDVSLRGFRPDVRAHFSRQDYLWSGWNGTASLEGLRPGHHSLQVVGITRSGRQIPCGGRSFEVTAVAEPPSRSRLRIGLDILLRTGSFLAWSSLVGFALASAARLRPPGLAAPVLGLALLGIFLEVGGALHVRPSRAAAALTLLALLALGWMWLSGRIRASPPSRPLITMIGVAAVFCVVGVVPMASHGEGAVLGDIDDASRESVVADSISRFGWQIPPEVRGSFASVRHQIAVHDIRPGEIYFLSSLADTFGVRAHEAHSAGMLGAGCLVVWSAGLLARTVLTGRRRRWWWLATVFVGVNSVVLSTLYWQHLGSLIGATLLLGFTAFVIRLASTRRFADALCVAATIGAALVFYPEALPVWSVTGLLALTTVPGWTRRRRAVAALLLAAVVGVALNPIGIARFYRYAHRASETLSGPQERMMTGDTHYFPSPTVIAGLEAYREDARAPLGAVRRVLVPIAAIAILATALLGWSRLSRRGRALVLTLIVPVAVALLANLWLEFPYGYAKILPAAAAIWSVAFVSLAAAAAVKAESRAGRAELRAAVVATVLLAFLLAIPSARHVWRRALRAVPVYDSDYRVLPELAKAVPPGSTIVVDESGIAPLAWIRYFLGENAVFEKDAPLPPDDSPKYVLLDRRRRPEVVIAPGWVTSRNFALVPLGAVP